MNYLRYYIPDSIVFITQVVEGRASLFAKPANMVLLREVLRGAKERHPFTMLAYVFLPDHFHILIRPEEGLTHSQVMQSAKSYFTYRFKREQNINGSLQLWQRRYWDHVIRDERDLENHLHYIHYNPVRHGLVTRPEEWPDSSHGAWVERGAYEIGWGWAELPNYGEVVGYGE